MRIRKLLMPTVALSAALMLAPASHAAVLVGHDLSGLFAGLPGNGGTALFWTFQGNWNKAIGVEIAPGDGYSFESLTAVLQLDAGPGAVGSEQVWARIHADQSGHPGALWATLDTAQVTAATYAFTPITFTAPLPVTLLGGQRYWFVLGDNTLDSGPDLRWAVTESRAAPANGAASLLGYRLSTDGGTNWSSSSSFNAVSILANPVPEPQAVILLLAGLGIVLSVARRRRHGS
jgi:hypothetical protein